MSSRMVGYHTATKVQSVQKTEGKRWGETQTRIGKKKVSHHANHQRRDLPDKGTRGGRILTSSCRLILSDARRARKGKSANG